MSRVNYIIANQKPYKVLPGVIQVTQEDYLPMLDKIQQCIDLFNSTIEWDEMWDIPTAIQRFKEGHVLFIWYGPESNIVGYYWVDENYIHNIFIHPSRPPNRSVEFLQTGFNFIKYHTFSLYCDDWNIRAQKFVEKLGGQKIIS